MRHGGRLMLWVDGVGGYLVCLAKEVLLGQPVPGGEVDVAILGDLSGRHARIVRDEEGYTIEPIREVRVDGQLLAQAAPLVDGSRIRLGERVRLVFRRPHGLSATARLDFASPHRTQPPADAVLLMADACVLGPGRHCHVVCHDWPGEVTLYRTDEGLFCRSAADLEVDGSVVRGRGALGGNSRVQGDGFSFSVEIIGTA